MRLTKTKRFIAAVLTVAIVLTMNLLPAGALDVTTSNEFISVDFSSGSIVETQYGGAMEREPVVKGTEPKIEMDSTLNRNVAVFDATGAWRSGEGMRYLPAPQNFTYEVLVWVSSEVKGSTSEVNIIGNFGGGSGTGIWVNEKGNVSIYAHDGTAYRQIGDGAACKYDQWMHVVGVHDAEAATLTLYVDGVNCGSVNMDGPVNFWQGYGSTSSRMMIGGNSDVGGGDGWYNGGALKGKIAYAKVYNTAVSADDAAELYAASGIKAEEPSVPTGEDYTMEADPVPAFDAGDEVRVKLNINDINEAGLIGLDVYFAYDEALLSFNKEATDALWASGGDNTLVNNGWWLTAVADAQDDVSFVDVRMANDLRNAATEDGELYLELIFTALADSDEGTEIGIVTLAEGTLNDAAISAAYGTGTVVTAAAPLPQKLELASHETKLVLSEGYLRGLTDEQTPDSLVLRFKNSESVVVVSADGSEMAEGAYVGTGCLVRLMDGDEVLDEVQVVLRGDTNGDGQITTADYMRVRNLFMQIIELEGVQLAAADTDGNGEITTADYMQIRNHFAGIYNLFVGLDPDEIVLTEEALQEIYDATEESILPIGGWVPTPESVRDPQELEQRYADMAAAGINYVVLSDEWSSDTWTTNVMNAAEKAGIGVYLHLIPGVDGTNAEYMINYVERFKDHPALAGVYLKDEPTDSDFEYLSEMAERIRAMVPDDVIVTANLLPTYGVGGVTEYNSYVRNYMRIVQPDTLWFDHYPFTTNPVLDDSLLAEYAKNLDIIREEAAKNNVDAYSFIQNSAWEDRRAGGEAELRFLVNYNLLFGMRGITWYTWAAGGSVTQSAIAEDGTKTDSYYSIQNIDADLKAMKGVYMDFDQDGFIFHNTPIDRTSLMYRTRAYETYGPLTDIVSDGEILIGCFKKDNGAVGFYVMNYDYSDDGATKVTLNFDGGNEYLVWGADGLESGGKAESITFDLEPGDAKFVVLEEGSVVKAE